MLPAVLDPWAAHALVRGSPPGQTAPGSKGLAGRPRPRQAPAGDDEPWLRRSRSSWWRWTAPAAASRSRRTWPPPSPTRFSHPRPGSGPASSSSGGWDRPRAPREHVAAGRRSAGLLDQFQGVDQLSIDADGAFQILERVEGGKHQISTCVRAARRPGPGPRGVSRTAQQSAGRHAPTCGPSCRLSSGQGREVGAEGVTFSRVALPGNGARRAWQESFSRRARARDRGVDREG